MDARSEILSRIRSAVSGAAAPQSKALASERTPKDVLEQFVDYARDYKAEVHVVESSDLKRKIESVAQTGCVIPTDFPTELIPQGSIPDTNLSAHELDQIPGVLTLAAVAIAETGTVVLDHGPGQGRRAISLVPDHHISIVYEHQIVATVPEAVERLAPSIREGCPLTFISGPSATSDIELVRVEGVHGPRKLDIIVVLNPDKAVR